MDTMQRLIATLLKAAVKGESQLLPEGYDLESAMTVIRKQGLASLAYEGAYICGISGKEPVMQELFKLYYQILLHSERQMRKIREVCRAFEENGIDYLPFKGCVLKTMYPRPELRPMGDADILIRAEQYAAIEPIMNGLGFELKDVAESVLTWEHNALCLELHRKLYGPADRDLHDYYADIWNRAIRKDGCQYVFSAEDTFLHMFTHFVKHYRSGGIGCRHVLDLWVYRCKNPDLDEQFLEQELQKLHLQKFYHNTLDLLNVWFEDGVGNSVTELMTQWIFSGGAFGDARAEQVFKTLREMENHPGKKRCGTPIL